MALMYGKRKSPQKFAPGQLILTVLLLFLASGFFLPRSARAAITYVQSANNYTAATVTTLSQGFSSNNTAGNFIIAWVRWGNITTAASVSDSAGNVYQPL